MCLCRGLPSTSLLLRRRRQGAANIVVRSQGPINSLARRYSPNLSRRCTHLLVARHAPGSDKLASAMRNREKWGLKLVGPNWLVACVESGSLQSEAGYPVLDERTPLAARPANKVCSLLERSSGVLLEPDVRPLFTAIASPAGRCQSRRAAREVVC
jgi:hypothetical protein